MMTCALVGCKAFDAKGCTHSGSVGLFGGSDSASTAYVEIVRPRSRMQLA